MLLNALILQNNYTESKTKPINNEGRRDWILGERRYWEGPEWKPIF